MSEAARPIAVPAAPAATGRSLHQALRRLLRRRLTRVMLGAHLALAAVLLAREAGWLQMLELAAYDRLVVAGAGHASSDRIVLVTATEEDIARFGWPLRDAELAAVLDRLTRWKARVIGVDLYRDQRLEPGSAALESALQRNPDIVWVYKLADDSNRGVAAPEMLRGTGRAVLADIVTDAGAVVRRGLLMATDPGTGRNVRTLGLALAERMAGVRLRPMGNDLALSGRRVPLVRPRFGPYARVDAAGYQTLMDYRGGTDRFRSFSIADLLGSEAAAAAVAGRAVIVGTEALSLYDAFATPFSTGWGGDPPQAGVTLHAQLADQLLRAEAGLAEARMPTSRGADAALIWLCALLGGAVSLWAASARGFFAAVALAAVALILGDYATFTAGLILPGVPCVLALVVSAATGNGALHAIGLRERVRLQRSFEHYLDPRIIQDMVAAEELPSFGGEHREISVLFTDIAGFTSFAEAAPVDAVARLLHEYFDGVCGAALRHGGLVSEFTGDGVLCLFGAPQAQPDHPDRAVHAALAIDAFAEAFRAGRAARGETFGLTRIGVHTGVALVGNLGTSTRLRYSALGDLLNTASRIEGLNKLIGTRICVSRDTARRCRDHRFQTIGDFVVKGRQGAVTVAMPLRADDGPDAAALAQYDRAYAALRDGDADAPSMFDAVAEAMPGDFCVAFHRRRIAAGETGVRLVMETK